MNRGLLALLAAARSSRSAVGAAESPELRTGVFEPPRPAPDFSLRGSDGSELKLSRYRGKVVALGFGYSFLPRRLSHHAVLPGRGAREAGRGRQGLPGHLRHRRSRKRQRGASAEVPGGLSTRRLSAPPAAPEQLADVRKAYGIQMSKQLLTRREPVRLLRSPFVVCVSYRSRGNLRAMMPFGVSVDDIAHDVKALLSQ